jgi:hypothetical protein
MDVFAKHCQAFGSLGPFKLFSLYIRGREELVVTINREALAGPPPTVSPPTKNVAKLISTLTLGEDSPGMGSPMQQADGTTHKPITPEPSPPHREWSKKGTCEV